MITIIIKYKGINANARNFIKEMIPEMNNEGHDYYGVLAFIIGFVIMMILDSINYADTIYYLETVTYNIF